MNAFRIALCALVFAATAQARPVIVEESAIIRRPDASWQFFGRFGVAIDGDWVLVSGERFVPDPQEESGMRHEGAALLYRRNGTAWTFVAPLGAIGKISDAARPGLAMKDGVAMTIIADARIFERVGSSWTQAPFAGAGPGGMQGPDIEIESGRILVSRTMCFNNSAVLRKIGGTWSVEGEFEGHTNTCGNSPPSNNQDLQGDRAMIFNEAGIFSEPRTLRVYGLDDFEPGWQPLVTLDAQPGDTSYGPHVAVNGKLTAIAGPRERGTSIIQEINSTWGQNFYGLQPMDSFMQPHPESTTSLEHFGPLFAQRNYSFDRGAHVINVFRAFEDFIATPILLATLQARNGGSLGSYMDASGNRFIVSGRTNSDGNNIVRIFELPTTFDNIRVQMHDFETASSGAAWQPVAGSSFAVVTAGNTHVYRQSSTTGDAASLLPASQAKNHSIQAEITVRSFAGADRWVGLTTRRSDDSNYYYVTLRSSGTVQLKRILNGALTTLANAPATVTIGRKYRLRLESMGTAHRVYLDDHLVLTAYDATLREGTAGIAMYRASADYDNVIVTPSPFTTIYAQDFSAPQSVKWVSAGNWTTTGGVYRLSSASGNALSAVGTRTDDEIVQVRVRATDLTGGNRWVGVMARFEDQGNFLYVTLRNNNRISLRRLWNDQVLVLDEQPFTVTAGTWYTVRLEVVNDQTRVYVNNQLRLWSNEDPGPRIPNPAEAFGKVGLVTYRAAADYDDFLAYQP